MVLQCGSSLLYEAQVHHADWWAGKGLGVATILLKGILVHVSPPVQWVCPVYFFHRKLILLLLPPVTDAVVCSALS